MTLCAGVVIIASVGCTPRYLMRRPCQRTVRHAGDYCWQHRWQDDRPPEPPTDNERTETPT